MAEEDQKLFMFETVKIIDACRQLNVVLTLKAKKLRSSSFSPKKFPVSKTLIPQSDLQKQLDSVERNVRFISTFACRRDKKSGCSLCDEFPEEFIRFLLIGAVSENETARVRSCRIISEIIMRLRDDAKLSDELRDKVIDCMKIRVEDKDPQVRMFAVRALAQFANDAETSSIIDAYLLALPLGRKDDHCKNMPPSNATSATIIDCTLDVSESVRKAAYQVLANNFPLQSLSIKLRTTILQRGLADRSSVVTKEFLKLMKDEWLVKCCNGDPVMLLEFLDVEKYETVGEAVMRTLLKAGMVDLYGQATQQILESSSKYNKAKCIKQMEGEVALYWRTLCQHLQTKSVAKGSDAATTTGTEATVYAPEESDNNGLLKKILPLVSDYVELVRAHLAAGPKDCFTCRQLLLLGVMLDYSDSTNRKVASAFVQELLHGPLEHEVDEDGEKVIIGDGINREWATAVSQLAKKVHASIGEFEEVVLAAVDELAQPCRERTADFMQWMQCLAVATLLLENVKSLRCLQGRGTKPAEVLLSILLPGAQHAHLDVQRVSLRCLGLLERKPSYFVKQLRISLINSPSSDSIFAASQALVDLGMWHGRQEVDQVMGSDVLSQAEDDKKSISSVYLSDAYKTLTSELLDLLVALLARDVTSETYDRESFQAVLGEGIAKILLLSENYPSIPTSLHHELLVKLIELYFGDETEELQRYSQEDRQNIIPSLPPVTAASATTIRCTLDGNELVRKAAYSVLPKKRQSLRVPVPEVNLDGTSISVFRRREGFVFSGDTRRTRKDKSIGDRETSKIIRLGKDTLYGRSGQVEKGDEILKKLKRFVAEREMNHGGVIVEEVAKRASECYRETFEGEWISYSAVLGGFDMGSDVPSRIWVVNKCWYWPLKDDYGCIGSGQYYCSIDASTFEHWMSEERTKQIAYKSVFLGAKSSFSTGGKVTICSLRKEHCSSSKEELPMESKLIVDLMDEYDDHFDELDEGWTCTKSLWQAVSQTVGRPGQRAFGASGVMPAYAMSLGWAPTSRPPTMIGLKSHDGVVLLKDGNFDTSKPPRKGLDFPVMQIKSLALVGLEMRFFPEIVKKIKELLKDHEEVKDSRLCASNVVDLLMRKKLDRFSHPYYLMGGYERARSNVPPKLFLWLITKSGYFMVEDGISIGSSFSEHIVLRKFGRELTSKTAVSIGLEAIVNKNVTCTIVELPTTRVKSKQERFLPELVREELHALPEYSKQRPKARGTLKADTGKGSSVASPNKLDMQPNQDDALTRLPPGWSEAKDPATGSSYYYHVSTRKSQWEIPSENVGSAQPPQQDWIETMDEASGCRYYYNSKTGVSQWEIPESLKKVPFQHNKETTSRSTVNKNGQSPFFMQIKCMGCGGWGLGLVQAWGYCNHCTRNLKSAHPNAPRGGW